MISYELAMGLAILPVFIWSAPGSDHGMSLFGVVQSQQGLWLALWQPLSALIFLVALFAETNRLPFDMAESETDLLVVSTPSMVPSSLACSSWQSTRTLSWVPHCLWCSSGGGTSCLPRGSMGYRHLRHLMSFTVFMAKVAFMIFFFIWMRWTLPRFRYDQVMSLGWKTLLPLAIANLIFNILLIAVLDTL